MKCITVLLAILALTCLYGRAWAQCNSSCPCGCTVTGICTCNNYIQVRHYPSGFTSVPTTPRRVYFTTPARRVYYRSTQPSMIYRGRSTGISPGYSRTGTNCPT